METSLTHTEITNYVFGQLKKNYPDGNLDKTVLDKFLVRALERVEYCFSHIHQKYFRDGEQTLFNHLHSDQYAMFLYFAANTVYEEGGPEELADKLYYLNKTLHSIDVFYEVELPEIFIFRHCVGTVLGRANYKNYFSVGQNVTVGNARGEYPEFKEEVGLYAGSTVLGNVKINSNVFISPRTYLRGQDVPSDSVVYGRFPDIQIKDTESTVMDRDFDCLD